MNLSQSVRINSTYRAGSEAPNPRAQVWHWNETEELHLCTTGSCFSYTLCDCFHQCYTSVVSLMGRCYSCHMHGAFLHTCQQLPKGCYDSAMATEGFAASVLNAELPGLNHAWPGWPKNLQLHLFLAEISIWNFKYSWNEKHLWNNVHPAPNFILKDWRIRAGSHCFILTCP